MDKIVSVGIRITRKCNLKCPYCNITSTNKKELTTNEWKNVIDILECYKINKIVILGGEPTLYPDIVTIVDYIVNNKKMECSLTTNGINNKDIIDKLIKTGITSLGVSVDNLDFKKSISPLKCKSGLEVISQYCNSNRIVSYIVLSKKNIDSITELIKYFDSINVKSYILPYHWGNINDFDHRKEESLDNAFITDEDISKLGNVIDRIIEMKKTGVSIVNSTMFLENIKKHIRNLDWKCSGLSELRVDSDGSLACCCDKIGEKSQNYSIFDLKDQYSNFINDRNEDASTCKGCLWPSAFESELKRSKK